MENKLLAIQLELKVSKERLNNWNPKQVYKYRSCEDILEAAKPLLEKHKCNLTLSDEMVMLGNRFYVKATAGFNDGSGAPFCVSAFARETEHKSGMDDSQITGSASSYARKYALGGLFLLDNEQDADHTDNTQDNKKPAMANSEPIKRHTDASAMAPNDGLSVTGKISNHISGNPWHKFTINGVELSTKNPMDIEALTDHKGNDEEIEVTYTEITKGQWTNRYITAIRLVVKDIPF